VKKLLFMTDPARVDSQLKPFWEVRAHPVSTLVPGNYWSQSCVPHHACLLTKGWVGSRLLHTLISLGLPTLRPAQGRNK
jgi:hypothetical protein